MSDIKLYYSDESLRKAKNILVMSVLSGLVLEVFLVFFTDILPIEGLTEKIILAGMVCLFLIGYLYKQYKKKVKAIREKQLILGADFIHRIDDQHDEKLSLSDIDIVLIRTNQLQKIVAVYLKVSSNTIELSGYEKMDALVSHLRSKLEAGMIHTQQMRSFDVAQPKVFVPAFIGISVVLLAILKYPLVASPIVVLLILIALGIMWSRQRRRKNR